MPYSRQSSRTALELRTTSLSQNATPPRKQRVAVLSLVLGEVLAQVGRRLALGLQDVRRDGAGVLVDDHECVAVPIDAYHTLGRPEVVVRRAPEASGQWPAGAAPRVVLGVRLQRGVVEALVAVHLGEVWHAVRDLAEVL